MFVKIRRVIKYYLYLDVRMESKFRVDLIASTQRVSKRVR